MREYITKYPDLVLRVDQYPFTEGKELLEQLQHWDQIDGRKSYRHRATNYSLDDSLQNSIANSLENRMKTGNLMFLFWKGEVISYCGFRIQNNWGWGSRYITNPNPLPTDMYGVHAMIFLPFLLYLSIQNNCTEYRMSFNEHNLKIYNFIVGGHFKKFRQNLSVFPGLDVLAELFEDKGKQKIFDLDQWVVSIDLIKHREKITNFVNQEILAINNLSAC